MWGSRKGGRARKKIISGGKKLLNDEEGMMKARTPGLKGGSRWQRRS